MELNMGLVIQLALGAIGGNIGGALFKNLSLGTVGNTIAGIVGGGIGGQITQAVLGALSVDVGGTLGMAVIIWTAAIADAQERGQSPARVGWLWYGSAPTGALPSLETAIADGLRELGYVEGKTLVFEHRFADGHPERFQHIAADLVRQKIDVMKLLEQRQYLVAAVTIECAGRLVRENYRGIIDQGARDRDTLLLAAGEFGGTMIGPIAKPEALEQFDRTLRALVLGKAGVNRRNLDILPSRGGSEEVVTLKDETKSFPSKRCKLVRRKMCGFFAQYPVAS